LIEHYAGAFPVWLAPTQAILMTVTDRQAPYGEGAYKQLVQAGIRVEMDFRNEKLGFKIREAQIQKIPYMLVVGPKEAEAGTVSVRHRSKGDLGPRGLAELVEDLQKEVESRAIQ
jgi:threonyl-tRNA synthetase